MSVSHIRPDEDRFEEAVISSLVGDYLPCPVALRLSAHLNTDARVVGDTADRLGIRITDCQLGCFKVEKAKRDGLEARHLSPDAIQGIQRSLVDGRLSCAAAHSLSRQIKVSLKDIGDAATRMKIKIGPCQLNCFA